MSKFPMTTEGHNKLQAELKQLVNVERPNIIKAIAEAREHGDLSENAEYHSAKERQSFIEGKIADLEEMIAKADVINVLELSGKEIKFGATISINDEDTDQISTYQIVGENESGPLRSAWISLSFAFVFYYLNSFFVGFIYT